MISVTVHSVDKRTQAYRHKLMIVYQIIDRFRVAGHLTRCVHIFTYNILRHRNNLLTRPNCGRRLCCVHIVRVYVGAILHTKLNSIIEASLTVFCVCQSVAMRIENGCWQICLVYIPEYKLEYDESRRLSLVFLFSCRVCIFLSKSHNNAVKLCVTPMWYAGFHARTEMRRRRLSSIGNI